MPVDNPIEYMSKRIDIWLKTAEEEKEILAKSKSFIEHYTNYYRFLNILLSFTDIHKHSVYPFPEELKSSYSSIFKNSGIQTDIISILVDNEDARELLQSDFSWPEVASYVIPILKTAEEEYIKYCTFLGEEKLKVIQKGHKHLDFILDSLDNNRSKISKIINQDLPPSLEDLKPLLKERAELIALYQWYSKRRYRYENVVNSYVQYLKGKSFIIGKQKVSYSDNTLDFHIVDQNYKNRFEETNSRFKDMFPILQEFVDITNKSQLILEQLRDMDSKFPLFLPRLSELVNMEKSITEKTLIYVLKKYPEIGEYDEKSQVLVFSKKNEITKIIDELLKQYQTAETDKI